MAAKKDDLPDTHIYESGYEFQCDECDEWTNLGDTRPRNGSIVTCKHCGAQYRANND